MSDDGSRNTRSGFKLTAPLETGRRRRFLPDASRCGWISPDSVATLAASWRPTRRDRNCRSECCFSAARRLRLFPISASPDDPSVALNLSAGVPSTNHFVPERVTMGWSGPAGSLQSSTPGRVNCWLSRLRITRQRIGTAAAASSLTTCFGHNRNLRRWRMTAAIPSIGADLIFQ